MLYHTDIYINKINILKTFTFTFEFLYFEFLDIFLSTCKRWNSVYELKDVGSLAAGKKCRFILTIFVMISPKDTEHKNYSDDECIDWVYCVNSLFFSLFHSLESLDPVAWEWIIVLFFLYSPLNDVSFDVRKQHLQSSNLHADAFFKFRHLVYEARIAYVFRLERKSKRNYGSVLAWCMMDWCIMVTKLLSIHYRQASGF